MEKLSEIAERKVRKKYPNVLCDEMKLQRLKSLNVHKKRILK